MSVSVSHNRRIGELRVTDLRNELEKRGLEKNGVKQLLYDRLKQALIDEDNDPEDFVFVVPGTPSGLAANGNSQIISRAANDSLECEEELDFTGDDEIPIADMSSTEDANGAVKLNLQERIFLEEDLRSKIGLVTKSGEDFGYGELNVEEDVMSEVSILPDPPNPDTINAGETLTLEDTIKMKTEDVKSGEDSLIVHVGETDDLDYDIVSDTANDSRSGSSSRRAQDKRTRSSTADGSVSGASSAANADTSSRGTRRSGAVNAATNDATSNSTASQQKRPVSAQSTSSLEDKNKIDKSKQDLRRNEKTNSKFLWVSGLSSNTKAADLKQLFASHGKVIAAKIVMNAKAPGARCYGFVQMGSVEDANNCVHKLNKTEMHGRTIFVDKRASEPQTADKAASENSKSLSATSTVVKHQHVSTSSANTQSTTTAVSKVKEEKGKSDTKIETVVEVPGRSNSKSSLKSSTVRDARDVLSRKSSSLHNRPPLSSRTRRDPRDPRDLRNRLGPRVERDNHGPDSPWNSRDHNIEHQVDVNMRRLNEQRAALAEERARIDRERREVENIRRQRIIEEEKQEQRRRIIAEESRRRQMEEERHQAERERLERMERARLEREREERQRRERERLAAERREIERREIERREAERREVERRFAERREAERREVERRELEARREAEQRREAEKRREIEKRREEARLASLRQIEHDREAARERQLQQQRSRDLRSSFVRDTQPIQHGIGRGSFGNARGGLSSNSSANNNAGAVVFDKHSTALKRPYDEPVRSSGANLGSSGGRGGAGTGSKRFRHSPDHVESRHESRTSAPNDNFRDRRSDASSFREGANFSASSQDMRRSGDSLSSQRWPAVANSNSDKTNVNLWGLMNNVLSSSNSTSAMSATSLFLGGGSSSSATLNTSQGNAQPRFDAYKSMHTANPVARRF